MSYVGTSFGDISPRVGIHAVGQFLAYAEPILVLEKFGKGEMLPKNKGQVIKWRRPVPFDVSTTALTEGVTPAPQILKYEDVTAVISQYGSWVPFTDVIADTHEDPNLQTMSKLCGEQAASTKEALIWEELRGGTSVIFSGAATQRSEVNAPIQEEDLVAVQRFLKANHGKHITSMIGAGPNISTEPVAPAFVAFGSTQLEPDLRNLTEFVVREKYASYKPISDYEIGKFQDIRFILSPQLEPFYGAGSSDTMGVLSRDGDNVDVYPVIIIAKEAFAVTALKGMESVWMSVKNPEASHGDPLAQRGFVSWKMWYVVTRLNEEWMARIECAASA